MVIESNRSTTITLEGKQFLYFGGTNYLGLAHRQALWEAASSAFEQFGFSSGASRLTSGETKLLIALERELAQFADCEASLVLPAGFMSNLAVVDGLDEAVDYWIISKNAHGSIKTAVAQTTKGIMVDDMVPSSNDQRSLRGRLGLPPGAKLGFFAEPIDPLLGTLTDIGALIKSLQANDYLVLDEAHSIGVLGERGRGALEHFKARANDARILRTGTFSKALGAQGGFIIGTQAVIDRIKLHSNAYKVSTPLTPVACAASRASLQILRDDPGSTVTALRKNIEYSTARLRAIGYKQFAKHAAPIFHLPDSPPMRALRQRLPNQGMYLPTVTSYFADFCEIGLRWTIQSGHSKAQLDKLLDAITTSVHQPQR
jgi:8-amino-7-oxononanoate synthase